MAKDYGKTEETPDVAPVAGTGTGTKEEEEEGTATPEELEAILTLGRKRFNRAFDAHTTIMERQL